jgi:hypothetical protein
MAAPLASAFKRRMAADVTGQKQRKPLSIRDRIPPITCYRSGSGFPIRVVRLDTAMRAAAAIVWLSVLHLVQGRVYETSESIIVEGK